MRISGQTDLGGIQISADARVPNVSCDVQVCSV
jgi:hypothetical protein